MPAPEQQIRFTRSGDGVRVAFADTGRGYPLVKAAHWLLNLETDWQSPLFGPWIDRLSERYRLLRYDSRGCGLSDRDAGEITLEALVADLEAVVDAAELDTFALLGNSQGGAASIAYAARHPQRVSHLVLCGAFARGALRRDPDPQQRAAVEAMIQLVELGWGDRNSAFLQLFTSQFFPEASLEQMRSFNLIQRRATTPLNAARIVRAFAEIDVTLHLGQVSSPTLVMHCRGDARIPFEEGRRIAASITGARFEPLDSNNHVPLPGEPAFARALDLMREFLPATAVLGAAFAQLTAREREVLDLIARGLDNAQIAARLELADKTIRNRITAVFAKIGAENRAQAIVRARDAGFGR
jgi:pimeloyl-ACP methyl ester carboxylesterase/DNA-binding CsgD family transcriptional regulator